MSFKDDFNFFIGADYGIFKGAKVFHGQALVKNIQSVNHLSKETNVTAMTWDGNNEENILLGLSNQVVKTYDTKGKGFILNTDATLTNRDGSVRSSGSICGVARYNNALVTATESGHVRVFGTKKSSLNMDAGKNLSKMRLSKFACNIIGTGGKDNELKLWDLNTGCKTFVAKNVPHDQKLQLPKKVWVSDLAFLSPQKVVVGSRYGYVRLYDPKAQNKPVLNIELPEQAVSCIATSNREDSVLCGMAKGNIITMDLRNGKPAQQYKGFLGAVRDIVCHPTEPYIASVSLDRFLRVHNITTKELLVKEFLVTRMNCILMRSNFSLDPTKTSNESGRNGKRVASGALLSDGQSDNENEEQDIFDTLEEVPDEPVKKSRKVVVSSSKATTPLPSKKSTQLVMNPFASKALESVPKAGKTSLKKKKNHSKISTDDSDDDVMIISETVNDAAASNIEESDDSDEPDEADGESDEFEEDEEEEQ